MQRLIILVRLLGISIVLSAPFVLVGTLIYPGVGSLYGLALAGAMILGIAAFSERAMRRAYRANSTPPKGLQKTLQMAAGKRKQLPLISVFADPVPNALVIRSLGGNGSLLLSQGLITLLNERELRAILELCLKRLDSTGITFQSFCKILAVWSLSFSPRPWVSLVFSGRTLSLKEEKLLSPVSAIGFLILFPLARFLTKLGRSPTHEAEFNGVDEIYSAALEKASMTIYRYGSSDRHQEPFGILDHSLSKRSGPPF